MEVRVGLALPVSMVGTTMRGRQAPLEFLHFSCRAGRGENAIRELKIGKLETKLSYR